MARVIIDSQRCKACHLCIAVCPKNILEPSKTLNARGVFACCTHDAEACIGCLQCTAMCPDAAITVIDEEKQDDNTVQKFENEKTRKHENVKT